MDDLIPPLTWDDLPLEERTNEDIRWITRWKAMILNHILLTGPPELRADLLLHRHDYLQKCNTYLRKIGRLRELSNEDPST